MGSFNRRDFLRLSGLAIAGLFDAGLRIDRGFNWVAAIDWMLNLDSGVSQRERKQKLMAGVTSGSENFTSLLKFEALQAYANAKGFVLAEAVLRYFIYGQGQELDITDLVPESIKNYPDNLITPWLSDSVIRSMSKDDLRRQWANYSLGTITSKNLHISPEKNAFQRILSQDKPFYLEISGGGTGPNRDSFYGLYHFTQSFDGRVRNSERDSLGWKLDLAQAEYN